MRQHQDRGTHSMVAQMITLMTSPGVIFFEVYVHLYIVHIIFSCNCLLRTGISTHIPSYVFTCTNIHEYSEVYSYLHSDLYIFQDLYILIYTCMYMYIFIYIYTHIYMCIYVHIRMYSLTCTSIVTPIHMYICVNIEVYVHIDVHIHITCRHVTFVFELLDESRRRFFLILGAVAEFSHGQACQYQMINVLQQDLAPARIHSCRPQILAFINRAHAFVKAQHQMCTPFLLFVFDSGGYLSVVSENSIVQ